MDVLTAIAERRSIKSYDPNHIMTEEEIDRLLSFGRLAPSAFNLQHWRFVRVRDPELRRQIRAVAWDQAQVTDASLLLVLCADLKAWAKYARHCWRLADQSVQEFIVPAIDGYYRGKPQVERDEAMRSGGIVAQTFILAANGMGYGACPMDGFDFDAVGRLIDLPEDHAIVMMLAVGKSLAPAAPRSGPMEKDEVVFVDRFPRAG
ncbi:MAG TPA: nitroreductase family protein [Methylococcaceae bacterium]|nr:nitroreductase family protein [Methylococcaceae bacterium]